MLDKCQRLCGRQWFSEPKPLNLIALMVEQKLSLVLGFYALGDHFQPQ